MSTSVQKIYDSLGARYGRWSAALDRLSVNRLRESVLGGRGGEILEVAIGDGKNLSYYQPGSHVVGVDLSAVMLGLASKRAKGSRVDFTGEQADASSLRYPDGSFDFVVCTLAGCTFAEPDKVFGEMRRVLRASGRALFVEHVMPPSPLGAAMLRTIAPLARTVLGCNPERDTEGAVRRAGLAPERIETAAGGLFVGMVAARS